MTLDSFGEELYTGDVVVYSNTDDDGEVVLEVYLVIELIDAHTCKGRLMNTKYEGIEQYLINTTTRAAFVSESEPDIGEDEEDDLPLAISFN